MRMMICRGSEGDGTDRTGWTNDEEGAVKAICLAEETWCVVAHRLGEVAVKRLEDVVRVNVRRFGERRAEDGFVVIAAVKRCEDAIQVKAELMRQRKAQAGVTDGTSVTEGNGGGMADDAGEVKGGMP